MSSRKRALLVPSGTVVFVTQPEEDAMVTVEIPVFNLNVLLHNVRWTKCVKISLLVDVDGAEPTPRPVRVTAQIQTHMRGIKFSFSDKESIAEHLKEYLKQNIHGVKSAEVRVWDQASAH